MDTRDMARASSPVPPPASPEQQRDQMVEAMKEKMKEGSMWLVLCAKWWHGWKAFTGYEEAGGKAESELGSEDATAASPGAIDNSELSVSSGDGDRRRELRRDLTEGYDYVLLPQRAYDLLEVWYGGGPRFSRVVIAQGVDNQMRVELYPISFFVYKCVAEGEAKGRVDLSSKVVMFMSRAKTMTQVRADVLSALKQEGHSRISVKLAAEETEEPEKDKGGDSAAGAVPNGVVPNGVVPNGVLPNGVVANGTVKEEDSEDIDMDGQESGPADGDNERVEEKEAGEWRQVERAQLALTLDELLEDMQGHVEMLVETRASPDEPFPRDHILRRWRKRIRVGDYVDAKDSDNKWYESVVTEVKDDQIKVHFRGWASKWDAWVDRDGPELEKRFSKTRNWRAALTPGDMVDVRSTAGGVNKWYKEEIKSINHGRGSSGSGNESGKAADGETGTKSTVTVVWSREEAEEKTFDLDSEEICELNTHTRANRVESSSEDKKRSSSYGGSYGSGSSGSSLYHRSNTKGLSLAPGAVGLANLGNTCFMNSMLQCLSNTPQLTNFFLEQNHTIDLNEDNVLGMGGKVAKAYAHLMQEMWSGQYTSVVPSDLKKVIGQFQPQFAGFQQQDSQELMNFLLDGLHEDLNRVRKKPYVETVESNGRPDAVVAEESWRRHLMRNDSAVVDCAQGLLRSHVTCPNCNNESVTFDAYGCLSLPLPVENLREVTFSVQLLPPGTRPQRVTAVLPADAKTLDLKKWIVQNFSSFDSNAGASGSGTSSSSTSSSGSGSGSGGGGASSISTTHFSVMDCWNHRPFDSVPLPDQRPISDIKANDTLTFFQTEHALSPPATGGKALGSSSSSRVGGGILSLVPYVAPEVGPKPESASGLGSGSGSAMETDDSEEGAGAAGGAGASAGASASTSSAVGEPSGESDGVMQAGQEQGQGHGQKEGETLPEPARIHLLDLLLSKPSRDTRAYQKSSTDLFGSPLRVTYQEGVTKNSDIWAVAMRYAQRFLVQEQQVHGTGGEGGAAEETAAGAAAAGAAAAGAAAGAGAESSQGGSGTGEAMVVDGDGPHASVAHVVASSEGSSSDLMGAGEGSRGPRGGDEGPRGEANGVAAADPADGDTAAAAAAVVGDTAAAAVGSPFQLMFTDKEGRPPKDYIIKEWMSSPSSSSSGAAAKAPSPTADPTVVPDDDEPFSPPSLFKDRAVVTLVFGEEGAKLIDAKEVDAVDEHSSVQAAAQAKKDGHIQLSDCFDMFIEREQLGEAEKWYCSKCKEHWQAYKKFDLWSTPDVLILHLKRFQYVPGSYFVHRQKIDDLVQFPLEGLDLTRYLEGVNAPIDQQAPPIYDLYAVSEHSGTLRGGHYTAVAKNFRDQKVYSFNDSHVREGQPSDLLSSKAYVLFYKRRKGALRWAGLKPPEH